MDKEKASITKLKDWCKAERHGQRR